VLLLVVLLVLARWYVPFVGVSVLVLLLSVFMSLLLGTVTPPFPGEGVQ